MTRIADRLEEADHFSKQPIENMSITVTNERTITGNAIAYQGVKEKMETIVAELARKGIEKPKGFSMLEQFIKDRLSGCE